MDHTTINPPAPMPVKRVIDARTCITRMALYSIGTLVWLGMAIMDRAEHKPHFVLVHLLLAGSYILITAAWGLSLRNVRRNGPIETVSPVVNASTNPRAARIGSIIVAFFLALLTMVASFWTVMSACILPLILRDASWGMPLGLLAVLSTNVGVWWFTVHSWRSFLRDLKAARAVGVASPVAAAVLSNTAIASPVQRAENLATPASTGSRHWWTNTDTRDEIQQVGRQQ